MKKYDSRCYARWTNGKDIKNGLDSFFHLSLGLHSPPNRTLFYKPDILVFPNNSQIKFLNFGSLWYRAKEEKRLAAARDIEFSPQELALATVPGMNFDPRDCRFSPEELRPQPIIRKRKKVCSFAY